MIYYEKHINKDSNEWVTFIHGAGGSSAIWFRQLDYFKSLYNVILLDLRGHGMSKLSHQNEKKYSFKAFNQDIIEVLDNEGIKKTHLVGISLGSIIIGNFLFFHSERCKSAVLGGMVVRVNLISKTLLFITNFIKVVLPAMFLYRVLARIILPKRNQNTSRNKYIKEAQKITQEEFMKWFETTKEIRKVFKNFKKVKNIPILIIQGREDLIFLKDTHAYAESKESVSIEILEKCGHVVNIQSAEKFNQFASLFIKKNQGIEEPILIKQVSVK
jgi:pimeloyl-ACP methyl ester carboxylesterase